MKRLIFTLLGLLVVIVVFLRVYNLDARPLHNDEAVNGFFADNLIRTGQYKYDPTNYHGPTLYYFQLIPSWVNGVIKKNIGFRFSDSAGLTVSSMRLTTAAVSLLFLLGFIACRSAIGFWGMVIAFLFSAFSPNHLFFSRYFIHEIYVLLFTFGAYLGVFHFLSSKTTWSLYAAAASSALLFCTKETGLVHLGILGVSGLLALFFYPLLEGQGFRRSFKKVSNFLVSRFRSLDMKIFVIAGLIFAGIWFVFFSSFFTHFSGPIDSFRAYLPWLKQGLHSGHEKPWDYFFLKVIWPYETGLAVLSIIGLIAVFIRNEPKGWFLVFWSLGTWVFYSVVPYKTPWCGINMLLPMALLAGIGVQYILEGLKRIPVLPIRKRGHWSLAMLVSGLFLIQLPPMIRLNFTESTNERHPQVYVHTSNDVFRLIEDIERFSEKSGLGREMLIQVVSPEYWPIPFYLRNYTSAKYWGEMKNDISGAPLILANTQQRSAVRDVLAESYSLETYTLRPGYFLDLWINNAVRESFSPATMVPDLLVPVRPPFPLTSGLKKEVFSGSNWEGLPIKTSLQRFSSGAFIRHTDIKQDNSPFSLRWSGFIRIPVGGIYRFALDSDDGSKLFLDGQEIIDNGGVHSLERSVRSVNLSAGYHTFELKYMDVGGFSELSLYWRRLGTKEELVPGDIFFTYRSNM
ncbi:MAG: hypothetical protein KCHDKBKB_02631 [Elusimicrobia bacterium]|nr:hypothetical protein [Elusimicrobiota bacterium]